MDDGNVNFFITLKGQYVGALLYIKITKNFILSSLTRSWKMLFYNPFESNHVLFCFNSTINEN